jgi:hypothetical protein
VRAASFVSGRHPKTFTFASFRRREREVRFAPNTSRDSGTLLIGRHFAGDAA